MTVLAMTLKHADYVRLISEEGIDVFSELITLNLTKYYHNSLDVIKLSREINIERIKAFMN